MKTLKLLSAITALLGMFVFPAWASSPFGTENDAILTAPDSVKVWRTVGSLDPDKAAYPYDYYKKSGEGVLLSTKLASQLSKVLLDTNTYPYHEGEEYVSKDCLPEPGVAAVFTKGKHVVEFYICFQCNIIIVYNPPEAKEPHPEQGGQVDFDPGHNKLLHIIKKVFPKDRQIQELK